MNSYFSLVDEKTPQVDAIKEAFTPIKSDLKALACAIDKPVLFTEYGFRSIDYNLRRPWEHGSVQIDVAVNLEAQANAYTSFFESFWNEPWVAGGFFWEWFADGDINNPSDDVDNNGWYINGKPAEQIVKARYSKVTD